MFNYVKFVAIDKTTNFSPSSFVAVVGSGMDKNQDPGSATLATLYYTGRYLVTALTYLSWGATHDIEDLSATHCCSGGLASFVYPFSTQSTS
jgi:hypothetical protein